MLRIGFSLTTMVLFSLAISDSANADGMSNVKILQQENEVIEKQCAEGECTKDDLKKYQENKSAIDEIKEKFRFGIALGFETYKESYINEAETVGSQKIVRVSDSQKRKPSIWLETHYVWDGTATKWSFTHSAPGFYAGIRLLGANSDVFDAFSLGFLWSFKRTAIGDVPPKGQLAESINIGIGPVWHKTKVLANGIKEGQPLPTDYNEVKFDKRDETSWMLMLSAGF